MHNWAKQFAVYPLWFCLFWLQWALEFAVLEYFGVKFGKYPALTDLMIRAVPPAILAAFCGWMVYHFTVQYLTSPATAFWR
jgi:uncharacterized membrane protein YjjB (DUF3815 family)